jgi:hypothetical protein
MDDSARSASEQRLWTAATTGEGVDLRTGDSALDSPERGSEWAPERVVRAAVIEELLLGAGEAAALRVKAVRLQGARITGKLNLEAATLRCPLALVDCSFDDPIILEDATALSVRLSRSHAPYITANQLQTRGDFSLDGFSTTGGVYLSRAHIGGQLDYRGGQLANNDGRFALSAAGLIVDGEMRCSDGFSATSGVYLAGARISGLLDFSGGHLSSAGLGSSHALEADGLIVGGEMVCGEGFTAMGGVSLKGAHIRGDLLFAGAVTHPGAGAVTHPGAGDTSLDVALNAGDLFVEGYLFMGKGFTATGSVDLARAHITGNLVCSGGQFSKGPFAPKELSALEASNLTVDRIMSCDAGFSAMGGVNLSVARIGGFLICSGGRFVADGDGVALNGLLLTVEKAMFCDKGFSATGEVSLFGAQLGTLQVSEGCFSNSNTGGTALYLEQAMVRGDLWLQSATLKGVLDLTAAKVGSYHDDPASWQAKLRLDRFVYDAIEPSTAKVRLKWLRRNAEGYSPQIYNHLAAIYQREGRDDDVRRVLIAKQRRRSVKGGLAGILWGGLLDVTVGYGYRTGRALVWWLALLALGTVLFGYVDPGEVHLVAQTTNPPPIPPFFYTLDLLLPFLFTASFPHPYAWEVSGAALWLSIFFNIMGWILGLAVVASVTGLTKRDTQ